MKHLKTWIQRAYIRAALFFIGPALRAERESRAEDLRALGSQISIVVDEQISKYAARPPRPSGQVGREEGCTTRSEGAFVVNAADLAQVETRRLEASELPVAMQSRVLRP